MKTALTTAAGKRTARPPRFARALLAALACAAGTGAAWASGKADDIARGRYLIVISGCNDCHTPGYIPAEGRVDEKLWLTGDTLGWSGPWGTTYATNLRLRMSRMSASEWLVYARAMKPRPPMPWFNLRAMTDDDLRAIHAYVRALGPAGKPEPAYVPPGQKAAGPVVRFPG